MTENPTGSRIVFQSYHFAGASCYINFGGFSGPLKTAQWFAFKAFLLKAIVSGGSFDGGYLGGP